MLWILCILRLLAPFCSFYLTFSSPNPATLPDNIYWKLMLQPAVLPRPDHIIHIAFLLLYLNYPFRRFMADKYTHSQNRSISAHQDCWHEIYACHVYVYFQTDITAKAHKDPAPPHPTPNHSMQLHAWLRQLLPSQTQEKSQLETWKVKHMPEHLGLYYRKPYYFRQYKSIKKFHFPETLRNFLMYNHRIWYNYTVSQRGWE